MPAEAFPTCVGMNRIAVKCHSAVTSVPHVRGDEPGREAQKILDYCVPHVRGDEHATATDRGGHCSAFPTCVGMNRLYTG